MRDLAYGLAIEDIIGSRDVNRAIDIDISIINRALPALAGYIAGTNDGIVTVAGQPASREILCLDAMNYQFVCKVWSMQTGKYLLDELNPTKQYLVMVRDLPPTQGEQRYEPFCYDYVKPAIDLTIADQQALWQSWQK